MTWILEHWDLLVWLATFAGFGVYANVATKVKNELVEVIDRSSAKNSTFKSIARTTGKKAAAKALAKLAG